MRPLRDGADVLLDTEEFFRSVRQTSLSRPLTAYALFSFMGLLINWGLLLWGILPAGLLPFQSIVERSSSAAFAIPVVYFGAGFLFAAFYTALVAFLLGQMGHRVGMRQVFTAVAYGFTPSLLSLWIPVIGVVLVFWSVYLTAMGLGMYNGASLRTNLKACLGAGTATAALVMALLLVMGIVLISGGGGNISLLWTVLIPQG